jgi:hypothetical protein
MVTRRTGGGGIENFPVGSRHRVGVAPGISAKIAAKLSEGVFPMAETQETQHLRPPAGLTKSERAAFRALVGSQKARKGPISDAATDYVKSRARLRILQKLLATATRENDGSWPSRHCQLKPNVVSIVDASGR